MPNYKDMLRESGMPVTEEEMKGRWDELNKEHGSQINNDSKWSPFWRLISAIVTEPCKQLVALLVDTALPNLFLQTAKGKWLDVLVWAVDVTRKAATQAEGTVEFTRSNTAGELVVPAGTVIESPPIEGTVYRVATSSEYTFTDGLQTLAIPVKAVNSGTAYNLGPGYYSILPQPVPGILSVSNPAEWLTTPGADEEQDEELRLRGRNQFSAVGQYHHDASYRAEIASAAGIRTDYIYFEHGAPRGPGSANAFIMIESGAAPQDFVDEINTHIQDTGHHGHGDDMRCFPMPETSKDLAATVHPIVNLTDDQKEALKQGVTDRIRCAFRENTDFAMTKTKPWSRFSLSQLDRELHDQLPSLESIEFTPGTDIVTDMSVAKLGTLTVELGGA